MLASHGTTNQKAGSSNLSGRTIFSITWRRCGREGRARARCSAGPEAGGRSAPPLGSSPLPWHFCAGSAGDLPAGSVAGWRAASGSVALRAAGKDCEEPGGEAPSRRFTPGHIGSPSGLQRLRLVGSRATAAASGGPPGGSGATKALPTRRASGSGDCCIWSASGRQRRGRKSRRVRLAQGF